MKVGTFFSGIGSPEQALLNLGIKHDIEFACDIDKYARQTYLKNFDCKKMYEDITTLNMKDLSYVDLLVFGFPCQAFSMAGKRGGFEDTRGTLFYDALRYLKQHKPRYFIAENVKGLLSHDSGKTFQTIIDCLASTVNSQMTLMPFDNLGYHIHFKVLNTKDYGIPQNRERIFILGIRDDKDNNFRFPKEIPLEIKLKDLLQNNVNDKYYLSKKMIKNITTPSNGNWNSGKMTFNTDVAKCINARVHKMGRADTDNYVISHSLYPRSGNPKQGGTGHLSKSDGTSYCLDTGNAQAIEIIRLQDLKIKVSKRVYETPKEINEFLKNNKKGTIKEIAISLNLPKTQVEHYFRTDNSRAIPNPKIWMDLKKLFGFNNKYDKYVTEIKENIGTYESACRLYSDNGLSPTLQTQDQGYYKTQNKIRRLTPIECERLQGFPDNHTEGVSDTQRYKQCGNSITVNVMEAILKNLLNGHS